VLLNLSARVSSDSFLLTWLNFSCNSSVYNFIIEIALFLVIISSSNSLIRSFYVLFSCLITSVFESYSAIYILRALILLALLSTDRVFLQFKIYLFCHEQQWPSWPPAIGPFFIVWGYHFNFQTSSTVSLFPLAFHIATQLICSVTWFLLIVLLTLAAFLQVWVLMTEFYFFILQSRYLRTQLQ